MYNLYIKFPFQNKKKKVNRHKKKNALNFIEHFTDWKLIEK